MNVWPRRQALVFMSLVLLTLLLAGCGADLDLTVDFLKNEAWEATIEISFPVELSTAEMNSEAIEDQLDELAEQAAEDDVRISWEEDRVEGEQIYTVHMRGRGLDKLSNYAFDGDAEIEVEESGGRRIIHFNQYIMSTWELNSRTITLRGGEIIEGNGRFVDDQTMTWRNPYGEIDVRLTERSRFPWGRILGVLGGIVVASGLVVGGVKLWQSRWQLRAGPCPWCGFWIPKGARHCPGCGRRR